MAYGLRKINKDFTHHDFQWPSEVGAIAKCPDWNPEPRCGGGLHFLPNAQGSWILLDGHYWCVIEYDEEKAVHMYGKSKVEECKIVHLSEDASDLLGFFNHKIFNDDEVLGWIEACSIQDYILPLRELLTPALAYAWARKFGPDEYLKSVAIKSQHYLVEWAKRFGDRSLVKYVKSGYAAVSWVKHINKSDAATLLYLASDSFTALRMAQAAPDYSEHLIHLIDSGHAVSWAICIGDHEIMIERIEESHFLSWAVHIGVSKRLIERFPEAYKKYLDWSNVDPESS